MKINLVFLITLLLCMSELFAQKKEIDLDAVKNWERLGNYSVSNDGKYVWYEVVTESNGVNLIVCDASGSNKRQFPKANNARFSEDSKYIFFNSMQGIHQFELRTGNDEIISGASSYNTPQEGNGRWLNYTQGENLWLRDLSTGKNTSFSNAKSSLFDKQGNTLLIQMDSSILMIELPGMKKRVIFEGKRINHLIFDNSGQQIALSITENKRTDIFKYQLNVNKLELLVSDSSMSIPSGFKIVKNDIAFSENGQFIYFKLSEPAVTADKDTNVITKDVDVWSYKDIFLQSQQVLTGSRRRFTYVVSNQSKRIVQIENDSTVIERTGNKFALVKTIGNYMEAYWRKSQSPRYTLISLIDGGNPTMVKIPAAIADVQLSPTEKYVTFIDTKTSSYNCIDISSGSIHELSRGFEVFPVSKRDTFQLPFSLFQWIEYDKGIIMVDQNDIWRVDPTNKNKPICLTARYGKKNQLIFSAIRSASNKALASNDSLLLSVIDESTKYNGFTKVNLSTSNIPHICLSGPYMYFVPSAATERHIWPPKKARDAEVYLVQRQSVAEDPNIFLTKDFNTLQPVSNIESHLNYKWHKSKLERWTAGDGSMLQGILYYPVDLDTTKKYPIIFNYYEKRNHELFKYNDPSYLGVTFNAAWYLNRDYLVFIPDIDPSKGATGESALKSVISAANFLTAKYTWIDQKRMGLQGHSHGGFITNFIVTHSNLFAAAQSASGYSDFVRGYGDLGFSGGSLQFMHEIGQNNLGSTPWKNPATYIKNSPIFFIDKVTTPLLLMHNKDDGAVQFGQSVELFTALRRLEKKVWLLQYDSEGHHILDFNKVYDFLVRQQQFFDHYLKGASAPLWMVEGIPSKYKGIRSGLQLDTLGRNP
jgi:dipeptidyl aminopeptidase/acylaminoacyl peptidase